MPCSANAVAHVSPVWSDSCGVGRVRQACASRAARQQHFGFAAAGLGSSLAAWHFCLLCLGPQDQPPTVRDRLYRYSGSKLPAHRSHILGERGWEGGWGVSEGPRVQRVFRTGLRCRWAGNEVQSAHRLASSQPLAPLTLWHSSSSTPPEAQPLARSHPPGAVAVVLQLLVALAAAVHLVGAGGVAHVLAAQVRDGGGDLRGRGGRGGRGGEARHGLFEAVGHPHIHPALPVTVARWAHPCPPHPTPASPPPSRASPPGPAPPP